MLKQIEIGEIINIGSEEYIIVNTPHKNGRMEWEQPTLVKLSTVMKNISRRKYFRGSEIPLKNCDIRKMDIKKDKLIKLTIN